MSRVKVMLNSLLPHIRSHTFNRDQVIYTSTSPCDSTIIVIKGTVSLETRTGTKRVVYAFRKPGFLLNLNTPKNRCLFMMVAYEKGTEVGFISNDRLPALLDSQLRADKEAILKSMVVSLEELMHELQERVYIHTTMESVDQVNMAIRKLAAVFGTQVDERTVVKCSQSAVQALTSLSRESVRKALTSLEELNVITLTRGGFELLTQ